MKKECETCKLYNHRPNILGGIAECMRGEKQLMTFWPNEACDSYAKTSEDKLKPQNDFYRDHVDAALKMKSGGNFKLLIRQ